MSTVYGPYTGEIFDRIEQDAMEFAGSVGLTNDNVGALETISRLFHGAAWDTDKISTTFTPAELRFIVRLLKAKAIERSTKG